MLSRQHICTIAPRCNRRLCRTCSIEESLGSRVEQLHALFGMEQLCVPGFQLRVQKRNLLLDRLVALLQCRNLLANLSSSNNGGSSRHLFHQRRVSSGPKNLVYHRSNDWYRALSVSACLQRLTTARCEGFVHLVRIETGIVTRVTSLDMTTTLQDTKNRMMRAQQNSSSVKTVINVSIGIPKYPQL